MDVVYGVGLDASSVLKSTKKVKSSEKQLQNQLKKTNKEIDKQEKGFNKTAKAGKSLAKSVVGYGVALVGLRAGFSVLAGGVKTNIEFEQSLANIKAVMRPTAKEFSVMSKVIRDQAKVTEHSATQVSKGMELLGMAGLDAVTSMKALPGVLELASAGALSMAEAANISTNIMSAMKLEAEDLAKVNDTLAFTASNSNTNIQQLGEAFRVTAGIASATNQNITEVSKVLGAMANRGLQGANAGEKFKQMLTRLIKPSGAAKAALVKLGVATRDANDEMRPMSEIMRDLEAAGLSGSDAIAIFGKFTGSAALAVAGAIPDIDKLGKGLETAAGFAKETADIRLDTLAGDLKLLASAWEEVILSTNESNKQLRTFVQLITKGLSFIDLGKSFQLVSGIMGAIANSVVFMVESVIDSMQLLSKILVAPFELMARAGQRTIENITRALVDLSEGEFSKALENALSIDDFAQDQKNIFGSIKKEYNDLGENVVRFQSVNALAWKDITMQTEKQAVALEDLEKTSTEKTGIVSANTSEIKDEVVKLNKALLETKDLFPKEKVVDFEPLDIVPPEMVNIDNIKGGTLALETFATTGERVALSLKESFATIAGGGLKSFISAGLKGTNALEAGVNALKDSVIDLATTLASKALTFGLLSLLSPGSKAVGDGFLSFLGFKDGIVGFDSGVIGMGGAGTGTSDSNLARLSKGESVMTAKATSMFAPLLANMERSASGSVNYGGNAGSSYASGSIGIQSTGMSNGNINVLVAEIKSLKNQILLSGNATTRAIIENDPFENVEFADDKDVAMMVNMGNPKLGTIG